MSRYVQFHPRVAGVANAFELAIRFHIWASSLEHGPTIKLIRDRFNVSRATAYRWLNGWHAANGMCQQERVA